MATISINGFLAVFGIGALLLLLVFLVLAGGLALLVRALWPRGRVK